MYSLKASDSGELIIQNNYKKSAICVNLWSSCHDINEDMNLRIRIRIRAEVGVVLSRALAPFFRNLKLVLYTNTIVSLIIVMQNTEESPARTYIQEIKNINLFTLASPKNQMTNHSCITINMTNTILNLLILKWKC